MFKRTQISNSTALLLVACLVLVCTSLAACKTEKGDTTENISGPTVIKSKVSIPKGLKFTNEMLEVAAAQEGEKTDSTFSNKEELLDKRANKDITAGKLIKKDDVADKDVTFEEDDSIVETKEKSEETPVEKQVK